MSGTVKAVGAPKSAHGGRSGLLKIADLDILGSYLEYARSEPSPSMRGYVDRTGDGDTNSLGRHLDSIDQEFDVLCVQHVAVLPGGKFGKRGIRYREEMDAEILRITEQAGSTWPVGTGKRDGVPTLDGELLGVLGLLLSSYFNLTKVALHRRSSAPPYGPGFGKFPSKETPLADGDVRTRASQVDRKLFLRWLESELERLHEIFPQAILEEVSVFDLIRRHVNLSEEDGPDLDYVSYNIEADLMAGDSGDSSP